MKPFLTLQSGLLLLLLSAAVAPAANASVVYYTSEADFVAALDSYYLENFDDLAGKYEDAPESLNKGPVNGFSYEISTIDTNLYYMDGFISTNGPAAPLQFDFSSSDVTAFGGIFWPTDIDGLNGVAGINIQLVLGNGTIETYSIENAAYNSFVGFISTEAFTSITFSANDEAKWTYGEGEGLYMSADHIYAGTSAVPVPAAAWLLGTGIVGLIGIRKKQNGQ